MEIRRIITPDQIRQPHKTRYQETFSLLETHIKNVRKQSPSDIVSTSASIINRIKVIQDELLSIENAPTVHPKMLKELSERHSWLTAELSLLHVVILFSSSGNK